MPSAIAEAPPGEAAPPCPLCGGGGFVRRERPVDHPRFGKAEPCDCVLDEREDVRRTRLERLSNLGSLTRFTFESLRPGGKAGDSHAFHAAFDAAVVYAEDPAGWLVLTGPSGSGKTHMAAAIANRRIQTAEPVLFMVVADLLDHLRASYDATEEELGYEQLFDQVRNAPLLILDDIDAVSGTPWAKEKLFQVVNHRFNAGLATVFTTTQGPADLEDRLATRLADAALSRVFALGDASGPLEQYRQVGGMTRERLGHKTFADFVTRSDLSSEEQANLMAARQAVSDWAERPWGWLVLLGENGCGKTHLACAAARKHLARGGDVFFAVVPELLDYLRGTQSAERDGSRDELFEAARTAGLLVLDDLAAHKSSEWAQEKLYQLVNYRHINELPTIVTCDVAESQIQNNYPRMYSRMFDATSLTRIEITATRPKHGSVRAGFRNEPRGRSYQR